MADLVDIDKACEWLLLLNIEYYRMAEGLYSKELIEDFRKAMKEQMLKDKKPYLRPSQV